MKKIKISILSVFIIFSLLGCQTIKQKTDAIVEKENKKLSDVEKNRIRYQNAAEIFGEAEPSFATD